MYCLPALVAYENADIKIHQLKLDLNEIDITVQYTPNIDCKTDKNLKLILCEQSAEIFNSLCPS
jgi:hypothetical protein